MTKKEAQTLLIEHLTPRYGAGEASSIARIVFEDVFPNWADAMIDRFGAILRRLETGEPVQYVLGQADFFGLKFQVNASVLIPRQETEELVAWALAWLRQHQIPAPTVADIGLGSGCIAIALKVKRRMIRIFGLEKSPEALELASTNAANLLGANDFSFFQGDILDESSWELFPELDLVISNPPYIPHAEQAQMPEHVLNWEPRLALFVEDDDPLLFYRILAKFAKKKLRPDGALFLECNEFNARAVVQLLSSLGFADVELRQDISSADRMIRAQGFHS